MTSARIPERESSFRGYREERQVRTLFEIIEAAKDGKTISGTEAMLAMLALEALSTFDHMELERLSEHCKCQPARQTLYTGERFRRWKTALNKSPLDWLGDNVPTNLEYQRRRKIALKLLGKVAGEQ